MASLWSLFGASLSEPRIHEIQEVALYVYIYIFVCLWGDYFHEQGVKLRIANVGNGRQARVRTTLPSTKFRSSETGTVSC